eukprot:1141087-Pelagomonas_calceolata.AAC.15
MSLLKILSQGMLGLPGLQTGVITCSSRRPGCRVWVLQLACGSGGDRSSCLVCIFCCHIPGLLHLGTGLPVPGGCPPSYSRTLEVVHLACSRMHLPAPEGCPPSLIAPTRTTHQTMLARPAGNHHKAPQSEQCLHGLPASTSKHHKAKRACSACWQSPQGATQQRELAQLAST